MVKAEVIELREYDPASLGQHELTESAGITLWKNYSDQLTVDFPSPKTEYMWKLTSKGWVGYIPLNTDLGILLSPKIELSNLFRMWECAYRLKDVSVPERLMECQSVEDFYERLANILARKSLDRLTKGLYHSYQGAKDKLPYIRGRIDLRESAKLNWTYKIGCRYEELTGDIEDNQILGWTMWKIAQSGFCTERVMPVIRRACRLLQRVVTLIPCDSASCIGREYNRLNEDYKSLHSLCRFFLDQCGPSHVLGDRLMLPFLVDMDRLYEMFVAEWLKARRPEDLVVRSKERVPIGHTNALRFEIDLVFYDANTNEVLYVLDTKYKAPTRPSASDVQQVVTYAISKKCQDAILIYPSQLPDPLDEKIGDIRVRSLTFSLGGDLDLNGQEFINQLLYS